MKNALTLFLVKSQIACRAKKGSRRTSPDPASRNGGGRSKGYLGAYLRRHRARLGASKAITAAAHKLARIVYLLVRYGVAYVKQTEEAYAEQVRERSDRQLRRRAKEQGFEFKPVEVPVAA